MSKLLKLLPVIICIIFLLAGCKKDADSPSYLRGKIDGVTFECNSNIHATPGRSGDKIISVQGAWNIAPSNFIRLLLDGGASDITEGSYDLQTGKKYQVSLDLNSRQYDGGYFCPSFVPCSFYGSGKINILKLSKKYIKGTFEFVVVHDPVAVPILSKNVTDGEFYIKRS